jgi:hypothetical protein
LKKQHDSGFPHRVSPIYKPEYWENTPFVGFIAEGQIGLTMRRHRIGPHNAA